MNDVTPLHEIMLKTTSNSESEVINYEKENVFDCHGGCHDDEPCRLQQQHQRW